jgi:hypothetical protein
MVARAGVGEDGNVARQDAVGEIRTIRHALGHRLAGRDIEHLCPQSTGMDE